MSEVIITTITDAEVIETAVEDCIISTEVISEVVETAGAQGPPGKNGLDGMELSSLPDNQITKKPDGLYAPPASWSSKEW